MLQARRNALAPSTKVEHNLSQTVGQTALDRLADCDTRDRARALRCRNLFPKSVRMYALEDGQDLVEYTLLLGVMVLGAASMFRGAGSSVSTIWGAASTNLRNAATAATS